jgi:hypothetical protein
MPPCGNVTGANVGSRVMSVYFGITVSIAVGASVVKTNAIGLKTPPCLGTIGANVGASDGSRETSVYFGPTVSSEEGCSVGALVGLRLVGLLVGLGCVGRRVVDGFLLGLGAASSDTSIDRSSVAKKELLTGARMSAKNIVRLELNEVRRYPKKNIAICG